MIHVGGAHETLPPALLQRKAVVYVRQSTQTQVEANIEGRRRQYELVDVARRRGFRTVEVKGDDLGRSASGMAARPSFEKLVAALCAGEIGAVLCFDASRLARNSRDVHLPNSGGRSRQGDAVRASHSTASTKSRLSAPAAPGASRATGKMLFDLRPLRVRQGSSAQDRLRS